MTHLQVRSVDEKHLLLTGLDPILLDSLFALPEILEQRDKPAARQRLYPDPTVDDSAINDDWHQHVTPELRHLFVSATDSVLRDLTQTKPDPRGQHLRQLQFPAEHLAAWISALNQARLTLAELHGVTEADMEFNDFDLDQPRHLALFRIHVLGYLLQLLVELAAGEEQ